MQRKRYTTHPSNKSLQVPTWWLVDATNLIVGRMASQVAHLINGKHKATFAPHLNCGDKVVVINASKVRFTGKKASIKIYAKHTGYPGGFRTTTPKELLAKKPHAIVENAVRGMLPKNKLGRQKFKNLFVYPYSTHPHNAQKPEKITFPHS